MTVIRLENVEKSRSLGPRTAGLSDFESVLTKNS